MWKCFVEGRGALFSKSAPLPSNSPLPIKTLTGEFLGRNILRVCHCEPYPQSNVINLRYRKEKQASIAKRMF
jgi:hypothetical protein